MAANTLNYSTADIARGPVYIWTDVATPAAGAELTIVVASGIPTPDTIANPNATHWGLSKGGADLLYKPTTENAEADELTTPYRTTLTGEEVVISPKGVLQVGQDFDLMVKAMVGGTATTPAGKKKVTIGGLSTVTLRTVLAIWATPELTTKYAYWLLYAAFNDAGLALTLSRKSDSAADMAWRGFAVASRAAGDQLAQIVRTT